jgi:NAD(P)-dependent dehydrogenase (short-subunit alcohol dehydrogenase family)
VAEVIEGVDLSGKRAIVTGGASGIGLETAKALSAAGAAVTLAVHRPAAACAVAEDIPVSTGNDAVEVRSLDVSDLASVRRFCADTRSTGARNGTNHHGVGKPRFSLADYNDIPHNQRTMDRGGTNHQIVPH